jgi:hypothetical protein
MAKTHVGVRLEGTMLAKVDAFAERMSKEMGLEVNRAMALRLLVSKGLEAIEQTKRKNAKGAK